MLCVGCGGDETVGGHEVEPSVELGTGEAQFEAIVGEPTLQMAAGSQGGFHVWTSFVAYGFDEQYLDMVLTTTVIDEDGSRLTMRPSLPGALSVEDGVSTWRFAGWPAQVMRARCAHGKRVHIELEVVDSKGRAAHDERYCVVSLAEEYRAVCE
jgi:hypothetical protein